MLILTRRVSERVFILLVGDQRVEVTILGVKGNQVRIGITAPVEIEVHREEVWDRIQSERAS